MADRMRAAADTGPRRVALGLLACSAAVLLPWILYLTLTLPSDYEARHWRFTWVGFDCVLAVLLAATAVSGLRRLPAAAPLGLASGTLLACDAWFDVATASNGDMRAAVVCAGLAELPLAVLIIRGALRLVWAGVSDGPAPVTDWRDWWRRTP